MFTLRYRDTLPTAVADELDSLVAQLKGFLSVSFDEEGNLITTEVVDVTPTGSVIAWTTTMAPTGWLLCDGAAVSRVTYKRLFEVIGTTYGVGDGSTTYNLPDIRQRVILGLAIAGTGSTLAGTGGTIDHTHSGGTSGSTTPTLSGSTAGATATISGSTGSTAPAISGSTGATAPGVSGTTGAGSAHTHSFSGTSGDISGNPTGVPFAVSSAPPFSSDISHNHVTSGTTGSESSHTHSFSATVDSHTHGVGSLAVATHTHTSGTLAVDSHTHGVGTLAVSAHTHTVPTTGTANPPFIAMPMIIKN